MKNVFTAVVLFCMWSLRRRGGQVVPITAALLLLVGAAQSIGALHDISSVLVQRQIAQSWRGPYDILVRPPLAVSQPERDAGWIDPQSMLESYGGITARQTASIAALPQVTRVVPFATVGWLSIDVQLPLWLTHKGIYPIVQNLLARNDAMPVLFTISLPAVQAVIGVPVTQQAILQRALLDGVAPAPALHLSLHVQRLRGNLGMLPACMARADCWLAQSVRQGAMSYRDNGVQLLRYSRTRYV